MAFFLSGSMLAYWRALRRFTTVLRTPPEPAFASTYLQMPSIVCRLELVRTCNLLAGGVSIS
jgi:hypothetical protein